MYDPYPYQTITNRVEDDGPVWSPDGKYMAYVLDASCGSCRSIVIPARRRVRRGS